VDREPLARDFFMRDPVVCARDLVGCELVWRGCGGVVVETEAYAAEGDEACHTFTRPSSREFVRVSPPGALYVYLNYGVHWLLNFLVKGGGGDGFVLVRALEPTRGVEAMGQRRGVDKFAALCSGPGKLTSALGIDGSLHGGDPFVDTTFQILAPRVRPPLATCRRVGISRSAELPWRFLLEGSGCVSVPVRRPQRGR
jgi:DNA-3-methyladenine glycosylase